MTERLGYRRPFPNTQPDYLHVPYASTHKRAPTRAPIVAPQTLSEITGPAFGDEVLGPHANDLTRQHRGEPIGQRITVSGHVLDENGRPVPHTLVEVWQANAGGRYHHENDPDGAPLDPNFTGCGRAITDAEGRYAFTTIKPGAYPWKNHHNAWRPAHVHFSVFGPAFLTRLVTQMYFPGDPLLPHDPIFNSVADPVARDRMIAAFDWRTTVPGRSLGFTFDVVVRGAQATPGGF